MVPAALRPAALFGMAFVASLLALFFDWRGRLVRRLRTGDDGRGASDIAPTRR